MLVVLLSLGAALAPLLLAGKHVPEEEIDKMIDNGEAETIFQKAIMEQVSASSGQPLSAMMRKLAVCNGRKPGNHPQAQGCTLSDLPVDCTSVAEI